jgi:NAD(P)H-dependent flavin oxidoreductase YrpB (nitropropane dioxygenase family)
MAALSLGAVGINMGTRFLCTLEAPVHYNVKAAKCAAKESDTKLVMRRWNNTSRLFRNQVSEEVAKIEKESPTGQFEEIASLMSGKRGKYVFINGDVDFGVSLPTPTRF